MRKDALAIAEMLEREFKRRTFRGVGVDAMAEAVSEEMNRLDQNRKRRREERVERSNEQRTAHVRGSAELETDFSEPGERRGRLSW